MIYYILLIIAIILTTAIITSRILNSQFDKSVERINKHVFNNFLYCFKELRKMSDEEIDKHLQDFRK